MNLVEESTIVFRLNGQPFVSELSKIEASLVDAKDKLALLEKGTKEWTDAKKDVKELEAAIETARQQMDVTELTVKQLTALQRDLINAMKDSTKGSEEYNAAAQKLAEINPILAEVKEDMRGLGNEAESQKGIWGQFKEDFTRAFSVVSVFEAGAAIIDFGKEVFEVTAKFEKYEAVLTNALGSQEEATKKMDDLQNLAASTPFSIDELTESYVKYVNRGIKPSMEEMTKMGDIAASQGKSFDQLTEAVLDATTGEFERLKEFGIQAKKSGDEVQLSFKGTTETVKNTPQAINSALLKFGELNGVVGTMAITSKTLGGQWSNTQDSMDSLRRLIGTTFTPVFQALISVVNLSIASAITFVNVIRAIPAFVSENKTMIIALGAAMLAFNGQLIIATASSLANTAAEKARAITTQSVTIAQRALNLVMSANPIGAVIAVIAILVGAFATWYEKSDKVKASVSGLWNTVKTLVTTVIEAYKAFYTFDFAKLTDIFKNGAKKIGSSFNDGYNGKMNELRKENDASNKKANDKTASDAKANAKKIAENEQSEHKATLSAKEKAAQKHRADEIARAKEKAKKEKEDGIAEDKQMLAEIKKMDVESIKDANAREVAKLKFQTLQQIEQIATSKANQSTKAAWEKALNDKLSRDIADLEKKAREEKIADEKKAALEIEKDQDQKRQTRIRNSFDAEKAINEYELLTARNNQNEIQRLKLQRLDIEKRETLAKLQTELDAEKKALKEAYETEVAKAAKSGKDTTEIHRQYRTDQMSLDTKYLAQSSLATAQYQQAKTKELEEHNKLREENNKKFFTGLKGLMDGDYKGFMDGLSAKLGADKKNLSERTSKFMDHTDKVADYASQGFDFLRKLNDLKLQKDVNNLNKEKDAQIKAWEDKYKKGVITKDEFEAKTEQLNKQYAEKEQQLRREAFEKQKKMDIAQALINGALAIVKSLAMFGWPFGLIAAAAAGVMTGVQVAQIKSKTFAQKGAVIKNAGVPEGSRHGSKYGESGISLVDRNSGHEIGEMEGGEPIMILSRNTYQNNKPVVDKLLDSSLHKNGAPIYRNGGLMFEDGGTFDERMQERIREKREQERQDQEEQQQREAVQSEASTTAGDGNSPADNNGLGDTSAQESAIAANTKLQEDIRQNGADAVQELKDVNVAERAILDEVKGMRGDMNRLLGSINTNTANTAKSTKDLGALVVVSARFK